MNLGFESRAPHVDEDTPLLDPPAKAMSSDMSPNAACHEHRAHNEESPEVNNRPHSFPKLTFLFLCHNLINIVGAVILALASLAFSTLWYLDRAFDYTGASISSLAIYAMLGSIIPGVLAGASVFEFTGLPGGHIAVVFAQICFIAVGFVSIPLGAVMLRGSLAQGLNFRHLAIFAAYGGGVTACLIAPLFLKQYVRSRNHRA